MSATEDRKRGASDPLTARKSRRIDPDMPEESQILESHPDDEPPYIKYKYFMIEDIPSPLPEGVNTSEEIRAYLEKTGALDYQNSDSPSTQDSETSEDRERQLKFLLTPSTPPKVASELLPEAFLDEMHSLVKMCKALKDNEVERWQQCCCRLEDRIDKAHDEIQRMKNNCRKSEGKVQELEMELRSVTKDRDLLGDWKREKGEWINRLQTRLSIVGIPFPDYPSKGDY